jgi:peptidoglycan hydrolase CwlO-like protein
MNKGYVFFLPLIFLLLIPLFSVNGQNIDLSKAVISAAGPRSFYVRNLSMDGQDYSFTVKAESAEGISWSVENVYPSDSNILPGDVVLDFASGRMNEEGNAVIEGVVVGETFYSVSLDITRDDIIEVLTIARQDDVELDDLNRTDVLEAMFEAFYQKAYEAEIAEKGKAISGLKTEVKSLNEVIENLKESNASLTEEITRLKQRLTDAKTGEEVSVDYEKLEEILFHQLSSVKDETDKALQTLENTLYSRISALEENGAKQLEITEQNIGTTIDSKLNAAAELFMNEAEKISGRLNELASKVSSLDSRIAGVEKSISSLNNQAADGFNQMEEQIKGIPKPEPGITGNEIKEILSEELDKIEIEKEAISERIFSLSVFRGIISSVRQQFSKSVMSGFNGGEPQIGSWRKNGTTLSQNDTDAYFAKYVLPVPQEGKPLLYRFDAKSEGSGWVGLGLHLFAADSDKKGYGFGNSLLVWFTRDPDVYKSDRTWLELYRSNNDVDMYRVLNGGIEEPMDEYFNVEILYEPQAEYITIAVNGIDKIRFKTYFDIESGIEVSLRSLGPASFKNLSVNKIP